MRPLFAACLAALARPLRNDGQAEVALVEQSLTENGRVDAWMRSDDYGNRAARFDARPNAYPPLLVRSHEGIRTSRRWFAKRTRLRAWLLWLLPVALLAGCDTTRLANDPKTGRNDAIEGVAVCHAVGDGSFLFHEEPRETLVAHLLHGDGIPTGPVPGQEGFVFTQACRAAEDSDGGPCPLGMALIDDFCIDRWEAHLQDRSPYEVPVGGVARTAASVVPQAYISGDVAEAVCRTAGKRLCTSPEWLRACQGPDETTYPYGDAYLAGACNEGRAVHPVIELFGAATDWSAGQMNDPRLNQLPHALAPTGAHPACMSAEGVYDLHGNLHEWVADADGTFRGGFYVDAVINGAGCLYRTTAHGRSYHDYSTGFRCCTDSR